MRTDREERILNREQIAQALTMLREERRANPVTPSQRRSFRRFRVCFWGFWALYGGFVTLVLTGNFEYGIELTRAEILSLVLLVAMVACSVPLFLSIRGSWPLVRQTWRQFRLARKTGIWGILTPGSKRPRWLQLLLWIMTLVLTLFLLVLLLPVLAIPLAGWLMLFAIPGYIFLRLTGPRLDMLANTLELERLLEHEDDAAEGSATSLVRIPADDFMRLADIEDALIQRRRAEAIDAARPEKAGYALLKSRTMVDETGRLDVATRLRVEACFLSLARNPQPADATLKADGTSWHVPIPGTSLEIHYVVDENARRVDLLSLRPVGGPFGSVKEGEVPYD